MLNCLIMKNSVLKIPFLITSLIHSSLIPSSLIQSSLIPSSLFPPLAPLKPSLKPTYAGPKTGAMVGLRRARLSVPTPAQ